MRSMKKRETWNSQIYHNDKGDNEMIPGAVLRSPDICLAAEENPGKPKLGDRLMKVLYDQSSPQMESFTFKWGQ